MWRSITSHDTAGAIFAILASFQLYSVLSGVRFAYTDIARSRREYLRFCRIVTEVPQLAKEEQLFSIENKGSHVVLNEVSYSYPHSATPALNAVTVALPSHSLIAIVGENGSGKSTLAQIIRGVRRPTHGTVTWASTTRKPFVAGVPQHPSRWELTAGETATLPQLGNFGPFTNHETAMKASGAHQVVDALPKGPATRLGESWSTPYQLSGGQWQRLGNARGLLGANEALITIIDEPTSALDPFAEKRMVDAARRVVEESSCGGSVVVITHRLSSALRADYVIMLDAGRVAAQGKPEELLRGANPFSGLVHEWKLHKD
ncbi:ATP-binding cassette domain-containing protein [Corynebacterium sp. 3HC-13]|nr:ABC transporter ATP-binding protein [Corynebacterium poyangense]MBZ8176574.1 ATP-binding cassette domain-containing protein [Corynebacterium poyangense]